MSGLLQDLRFAARGLARAPAFTTVALVTLALGIGANTAIFSVIDAVLLRPFPYGDPERLVLVWNRIEKSAIERAPVASPDLLDYREQARLFEGFAATNNVNEMTLTGDGAPEQVKIAAVTDNFFEVLGVTPAQGRSFTPEDGVPFPPGTFNGPATEIPSTGLIVGHGFWQRRFGGDPHIVGRRLWANGQPLEVIGVLPPEFQLLMPPDAGMPTDVDAWMPQRVDHGQRPRDQAWLRVIARLRPGVSLAQANAEMAEIAARQRELHDFHRSMGISIDVRSIQTDVVAHVRPILLALAGGVGFVLLIACTNVASLMLARATARQREMAVRIAMGAGRWRLIRQTLTEGAVLAALGGALGLVLSRWGVRWLLALRPPDVPRVEEAGLDTSVLLFTLGAASLSALFFAMVPALVTARTETTGALRDRSPVSGLRWHGALVVAEVALALVLLIGAGLMAQSFLRLTRVDPGFQAEGALAFKVALPFPPRYRSPQNRALFYRQLEERLRALPGAEAAGSIFPAPLGGRFWTGPYGHEGDPPEKWNEQEANFRSVTPGYFAAVGARLVAGRALVEDDIENQRPVAVVDEILARRLWPESEAREVVGRRFGIDLLGNRHDLEVAGVVEHIRHKDLTSDGSETVYFPFHLFPWSPMTVTVRAGGDPAGLAAAAEQIVSELDAEIPVYGLRTWNRAVHEAIAPQRFTLVLIAIFAGAAMLLAAVGIHGVLSYAVRQRTAEIGLRMALGAAQGSILRLVVGRSLLLVGLGVVLGLAAAAALSRSVSSLLFGIAPTDPATYAALAAVLMMVALAAAFFPAWRASRVDPMDCLRAE